MTSSPSYNTQIPIGSTTIADAQKLFQNNFLRLFEAFNTDHVPLTDATNPGNHNVIQLVELNKAESTQPNEIAIYSKKVEGQTDQLFMRYQSNGKEFQLTQYQIYSIQSTSQQTSYFTFLPGGIVVYFGRINASGTQFTLNINPAVCTNITGINLCPIGDVNSSLVQSNITPTAIFGKFNSLILTSTTNNANQYYLIFGNL